MEESSRYAPLPNEQHGTVRKEIHTLPSTAAAGGFHCSGVVADRFPHRSVLADGRVFAPAGSRSVTHHAELLGMRIGDRTQQHRVYDAVDCSISADTKSQSDEHRE